MVCRNFMSLCGNHCAMWRSEDGNDRRVWLRERGAVLFDEHLSRLCCCAGTFNGPFRFNLQVRRTLHELPRRLNEHRLRVEYGAGREDDGDTKEKYRAKAVDEKDHYRVLGLRRQATSPAIKLAFRQLARQYHPDVNKDMDADEKFKSIRLAYEVLSDEASRRLYDRSLQDKAKVARRNEVYQHRERVTRVWSGHDRSQYKRESYNSMKWDYSYEFINQESTYYSNSNTASFRNKRNTHSIKDRKPRKQQDDSRQQDWDIKWRSMSKEAVLFLWIVLAMWHALGAQTALGILICSVALWRDFTVGYIVASGIAFLMGEEKGLAVAVGLIATTRVFGKAYHSALAILVFALWLGGSLLKSFPIPPGAILIIVYKCIELQSSSL